MGSNSDIRKAKSNLIILQMKLTPRKKKIGARELFEAQARPETLTLNDSLFTHDQITPVLHS